MTSVTCSGCSREFTNLNYLTLHLDAEANYGCKLHYFRRKTGQKKAASEPKKRKTVEDIERVLAEARSAQIKRRIEADFDYRVFEFHNGDSDADGHSGVFEEAEPLSEDTEPLKDKPLGRPTEAFEPPTFERTPVIEGEGMRSGLADFQEYAQYGVHHYVDLPPDTVAAVELMSLMDKKGGSLTLYDAIQEWRKDNDREGNVRSVPHETLFADLIKRYNLQKNMPYEVNVELPSTKKEVPLVCYDCEAQTIDLLTDPRCTEEDYLFWDNDPGGKPPEEFDSVSDVISGEAYRKTHKALIEPMPYTSCGRKRVLCPFIFYLDGCVTGQFQNQEIEILKFTLGIFNKRARRQAWAWRELGFVHKSVKGHAESKKMISESDHVDAKNYVEDASHRAHKYTQFVGDVPEFQTPILKRRKGGKRKSNNPPKSSALNAQDLHRMLQVMLSSYKEMEKAGGLDWDFPWEGKIGAERRPGKYRLVPFVIMLKLDGKEGDKLCLQYTSKSADVKGLCRICLCPTMQSHEAHRDDPHKTVPMIEGLVKQNKADELQNMSQQHCPNAFHDLTFGQHNNWGIHGATPPDATHWLYIGQMGYARECLFAQLGDTSKLSSDISNLATAIGIMLQRRSDRNLPRTTFNRGVKGGKLMAHEMTGVILVLSGALRTTEGRNLILNNARGEQKKHFPNLTAIRRWMMCLETVLHLEAWMKEKTMEVELVKRANTKLREYMNMSKKVANRQVGMKHNTLNHHITKHIPDSILQFGTPDNVDTDINESHHKPDKKTAQRTQKQQDKFDIQMGTKIQHRRAIQYAMEEAHNGRRKCNYYVAERHRQNDSFSYFEPACSGACVVFTMVAGDLKGKLQTQMNGKDRYEYDISTRSAIEEILNHCKEHLNELSLHDTLTVWSKGTDNNQQLYRASPHKEGKVWYDWAIFDLTEVEGFNSNFVPCQIKGIVDLTSLSVVAGKELGLEPCVHCIVEPTKASDIIQDQFLSELWEPWVKLPSLDPLLAHSHNKCKLVSVKKLRAPATLIPDIGNKKNKRTFLRLIPREDWAALFKKWLAAPHKREHDT